MLENEQESPLSEAIDDELVFAEETNEELIFADEFDSEPQDDGTWKILIVDDETEVHQVTQLALNEFKFEGKPLKFLNAYSGEEAKEIIQSNPDTALILLDVIMETDDAGLVVAKHIRKILNNNLVRIVLRTGQPGKVPEELVIVEYDIDDYKAKADLTAQKLFTTVITALRAFRALVTIESKNAELQRILAASSRFVPHEFLKCLQRESIVEVELGDCVQQEMSVLFSDIRAFTTLSERMTPKENFKFINAYLSRMEPVITKNKGFIDKYIGDGIMALFGNEADDAVKAGIDMLHKLAEYNQHRINVGYLPIKIGIGINTGSLILGTVGGFNRMDGTVISDAVNLASRIEGLTKNYGVSLLISQETFSRLQNPAQYSIRKIDRVKLKGKSEAVIVYEVFDGDAPEIREGKLATTELFVKALEIYNLQKFREAQELFQEVLSINSRDQVANIYLKRCQQHYCELP